MVPGIKIGLNTYKELIPKTKASVCEVYFRYDQKDQYKELFKLLREKGIKAGLHFWGYLNNYLLYNLAYPDEKIQRQTLTILKETIDIAQFYKQHYVNIHPGYYRLIKLDLDKYVFFDYGHKVNPCEGEQVLFENTRILDSYAKKRGVLYLTETMTCRESLKWHDKKERLHPANLNGVPLKTIIKLAEKGYFITNDFGHTLFETVNNDRNYLFERLYQNTKILKNQTKVIHTNTTKPPFTGIDTHNGVTTDDFEQNVLPNKKQLRELLKIFKDRPDVWLIPEPLKNHEENYLAICEIVKKI